MNDLVSILTAARDVVLHNWPSSDVPDTLVRAGFGVTVYGGPEPDDISVSELVDDEIISRRTGTPPAHADLMYVFPWPGFDLERDVPRVASDMQTLGASTLWYQSGRTSDGSSTPYGCWLPDAEAALVQSIATAAGLTCVHDVYIVEAVRGLSGDQR